MTRPARERVIHAWAKDAVVFNVALRVVDPSWGSEHHQLAGGWLVLGGRGMFVNRALAAGIDPPLSAADVSLVISRAAAVGVDARVEVSSLTAAASLEVLRACGFVVEQDSTTAFVWPSGRPLPDSPSGVAIRSVTAATLSDWQDVSALGWGHDAPAARRANDAFASAAFEVDGDGMVIAFDAADDRPLGCASLTRRDGVATLGGMSTLPTERRRGVQTALVRHRVEMALESGCEIVTAAASTGGDSARNLVRLGFDPLDVIRTWTRPAGELAQLDSSELSSDVP